MEQAYFLTVDWCNQGKRGIFCNSDGQCFRKEEPHTEDEMFDILGAFDLVLSPKSELFTIEQVKKFTRWVPLAEYSNQFGIALELQAAQQMREPDSLKAGDSCPPDVVKSESNLPA